jgi:aminobutyraldehyde dehydrogenase
MAGHTSMIRRDPVGVVASIAPWNYPLMMMAWKLAPAIGGGNTVVFKPSEQTPLTALKLARILAEELPKGVVNVVAGRGETVGNALIHHDAVDMISLTGDVATGKKMLQAASKSVKRTHLELGGKAPVIVFDDADIDEVVSSLKIFGYYNAGQDCTAACRVYASDKDLRPARGRPHLGGREHRLCPADDTENEIGPLISLRQRDRVASFVERARDVPHIEITTGGATHGDSGFYYRPTSSPAPGRRTRSSSARSSARSCRSRGSRTWIRPWPGPTIRHYGLASSVWTKDVGRAMATAARLRYGCTWINTHFMLVNEMPHGGLKQSGYGKDMSVYALEDYTAVRHVMVKH